MLATLVLLSVAAPAQAAFGLSEFDIGFTDKDGSPAMLAGSHPFAVNTKFALNTAPDPKHGDVPIDAIKDLRIELPAGMVGDPTAVPRCPAAVFVGSGTPDNPPCPDSTAVGVTTVAIGVESPPDVFVRPIYNLEPPPGTVLKLGMVITAVPVTLEFTVKESYPYNVVLTASNLSQAVNLYSAAATIWGYPGDHAHDSERGLCLITKKICSVDIPERPFITLPRSCGAPLETRVDINSWQDPSTHLSYTSKTHDDSVPPQPLAVSGCDKLSLSPSLEVRPTTQNAESSAGLDLGLDIDDEGLISPEGTAQSDIRQFSLALPEGVTANPSLAEGLATCTKADLERETLNAEPGQGCPQASKIGTAELESPLLEGELLRGEIFVATQDDPATPQPEAENPFDSLLAGYLVVRDTGLGLLIKQPLEIRPDPVTGQLTTIAGQAPHEIPQLPFSHLRVHLRQGPRAPLVTPPVCGSFTSAATFALWANPGALVPSAASFPIARGIGGAACPSAALPFAPQFAAGSLANDAASYSPLYLRISRQDGEQTLSRFSVKMPPGLAAKLAGVKKCPDAAIATARTKSGRAEAASPSCSPTSRIGRVIGGVGVGSDLTYVPGQVYLAGPFDGAKLSVVTIVPALAGPFDVGTVVSRLALRVDPTTGEAEVDGSHAEPLPQILAGVPVRLRDVRVYVDRPDFALTPTSCDPLTIRASISGIAPVSRSAYYQAANCASLKFKPKLSLSLKGGTKRSDHPALRSTITYPPGRGYTNIAKAVVTLPPTEFIDNAHIQNPCTRVQFAANQCPKGSLLGTARAVTPLLDQPLEGLVYFRSNGGERLLPDIVLDLDGEFRVILVGHVDSVKGRIRTTFEKVPDAPVSKFTLNLYGGKRGLLVNSRNLCAERNRADVKLTAQSGLGLASSPVVKPQCGTKNKRQK